MTDRRPARTTAPLLGLVVAVGLLGISSDASALPLFTARAGRTCDNCHSLPNTWFDPDEVWRRKCTLSCVGCHVDPSGGGLRHVSGRYFSETTVPLFGARLRPLDDQIRELRLFAEGEPITETPTSQPSGGPTVAARQEDPRGLAAPPATRGVAYGSPVMAGAEMAWLDGRYDDLRADPLLLLGGDARFGFWNQGPLFFPMQGDFYAALHPVEHLTVSVTAGIRGRRRGPLIDPAIDEEQAMFGVRDLWVMTHEWPSLAYLRVGRFMPAFGTRLADHTAPIRRAFGMSQENPSSRVVGIEVGMAMNYPYLTASLFKPGTQGTRSPPRKEGAARSARAGGIWAGPQVPA